MSMLIIGLDGGASKISGWEVLRNEIDGTFSIGELNAQQQYRKQSTFIPDFQPVNINIQLDELKSNQIHITDEERQQGQAYIRSCAEVVIELVEKRRTSHVLIGIGMPGLKTRDKRGIGALANGPRMPGYCLDVENELQEAGVRFEYPIHHLGSDADYCGVGEEYFESGGFRHVDNAYYLGGGTGTADALKLHGKLIPLDQTKDWLAKTWELKNDRGYSLERFASANGIQRLYSDYADIPVSELNERRIFPPQIFKLAMNGEKEALHLFSDVSYWMAELIFERISTIYVGWQDRFSFVNPNRTLPIKEHPFRGTLFDTLILGQRLADLMENAQRTGILWEPFLRHLTDLIQTSSAIDEKAKRHYVKNEIFNTNRIHISRLREAPALGAGVDAYRYYQRNSKK